MDSKSGRLRRLFIQSKQHLRQVIPRTISLLSAAVLFTGIALTAAPRIAAADITTGLQGYWQLNEGSGAIATDSSGNGNDGTLENSPEWTNPGYDGTGHALQFNYNLSQDVSTPVNLPSTGSISVWANPDSVQGFLGPAGWVNGGNYVMIDSGSGHWRATFKPGATAESAVTDTDPIASHAWSHLVMTWALSGSTYTIQLYVNGTLIGSNTWTGTAGSMGGFYIGRTNYFTGLVDEVRVYDRVLSGTDVTQLYGSGPITSAAPDQVTGLTATAVSNTQIHLSWTEPGNGGSAIDGYKIERNQGGGSWSTVVANTNTTATSYQDTGLTKNTAYGYRVSAINAIGTGTASSEADATTQNNASRILTVNSLADDGDGTCTVSKCTFRDALSNADDGDTVNFSVTGTIVLTDHNSMDVTQNFTIDGPGKDNLTIDFDNDTSNYIQFDNTGTINVSGLTFTNAPDTVFYSGGVGATYNISDCRFTENVGGYEPVYIEYGTWNLDNDIFDNNDNDDYAGAVAVSAADSDTAVSITNSTFANNISEDEYAGAVYSYYGHLSISDSTFTGNDVKGGYASALYLDYASNDLTIKNTTFDHNQNGGYSTIYDYDNAATFTNVTLASNDSTGYGSAGIYTEGATTHLVNDTLYNNVDGSDATLANNGGTIDAVNTVIAGGTCSGGITSLGHNLATDSSCPFDQHAVSGIFDAAGLKDNGGRVETVALLNDSPAVDTADDASSPATDARGIARPQGLHADIGAYEFTVASDTDNDGIANSVEDAAPDSGDGNNDGTPDSQQANVVSFTDSQTGKYVTLALPGACSISSASTSSENTNTKPDDNYSYPAGMLSYTADCGTPGFTATAKVYFYGQSANGLVLRKYNPTAKVYTTISGANLSQITIGGQSAVLAGYTITDGDSLDSDGVANGTIVDPVGLAVATGSLTNTGLNVLLASCLAAALITVGLYTTTHGRHIRYKAFGYVRRD